jgi:predicted RNase H-like HicB family nuclease
MRYPIAIEPGTDATAWGVVVPDLPGCFSAGDTMEEALIQAEEAVTAWIETILDGGQAVPQPSAIDALRAAHPEFEGWLWGLVKIDPAMLDNTLERVNISLPRRVLHRLDARARRTGETRSGFIARMAIEGSEPVSA